MILFYEVKILYLIAVYQLFFLSLCSPLTKSQLPKCNTFVFFDTEATGIPHLEYGGRTRMTELSLISVSRDEFYKEYSGLPRALPKLTIVMNPNKKISSQTSQMTGLNNFNLKNHYPFNENKAILIKMFLEQFKPPICLVAHNGNRFDLPLLKQELLEYDNIIPEGTRCVDSLSAFHKLKLFTLGVDEQDIEQIPPKTKVTGFKLTDLFLRLFGKALRFGHRAEYDTLVLIQCCLKIGLPMLDWIDDNTISYKDVKPTYHKQDQL